MVKGSGGRTSQSVSNGGSSLLGNTGRKRIREDGRGLGGRRGEGERERGWGGEKKKKINYIRQTTAGKLGVCLCVFFFFFFFGGGGGCVCVCFGVYYGAHKMLKERCLL